ncbi:hypothetical protein TSAR_011216 [Trichomalopsis sarcophagae]|uniref:Uncharacterized protein n=1 Tax=Trichomalopsis sarcophagae TaxID=543379 RepID=A0A232EI32_9HYME|nr:hypothetical protein TSAR_011216 [Trichomalopsis sarcophagae]
MQTSNRRYKLKYRNELKDQTNRLPTT